MSKSPAKSKKALNQSDVVAKVEMWSRHAKAVAALETEKDQDTDLIAAQQRVEELAAKWGEQIDKAQARADVIEAEILGWLEKKSKSLTIESKHAVLELVVGTKLGSRQIDPKKLAALCKKKDVNFFDLVQLLVGKADELLGKKEVDAISTRAQVPSRTVALKLK